MSKSKLNTERSITQRRMTQVPSVPLPWGTIINRKFKKINEMGWTSGNARV